jgi:hypothetical protein
MKNTVQFGQNLAKLPEILFTHSSRNRHFETDQNYIGHWSILTKSPIISISIKYTDIPVKCSFCDTRRQKNSILKLRINQKLVRQTLNKTIYKQTNTKQTEDKERQKLVENRTTNSQTTRNMHVNKRHQKTNRSTNRIQNEKIKTAA